MAVFDDVRLPEDVEIGARGGPKFQTTVTSLASGAEQRNQDWSEQRCEFDIGYGIQSLELFDEVRAFFYGRRGRARGFRFKDWSDYTLTDETIATGTGAQTVFPIIKTYEGSGPHSYGRRITRPVATGLVVKVNSIVQATPAAYTLGAGGILTFVAAPGNGLLIKVTCDFDVPSRFDIDKFDLTIEAFEAGVLQSLPVVELRE